MWSTFNASFSMVNTLELIQPCIGGNLHARPYILHARKRSFSLSYTHCGNCQNAYHVHEALNCTSRPITPSWVSLSDHVGSGSNRCWSLAVHHVGSFPWKPKVGLWLGELTICAKWLVVCVGGVRACVCVAHSSGLVVCATGVEDDPHLDSMHCYSCRWWWVLGHRCLFKHEVNMIVISPCMVRVSGWRWY